MGLMQQAELEELPDEEALQKTYDLSDEFYARMGGLKKQTAKKEKLRKRCKMAAAAAASFILVCSVAYPQGIVEAGRIIMSWEDDFVEFHFKDKCDLAVIPRFTLEYVPDGYEMKMDEYHENLGIAAYTDGEKEWHFVYSVSDASLGVDNKDVVFSILEQDGKEIYYLEGKDKTVESHMEWLSDDENIVFSIHGCLSKEEMLKIVEGVKEK